MATIHILFLGVADDNLIKRLKADGYNVSYQAAEHDQIWRLRAAKTTGTGYQMTKRMKELITEARSGIYDFMIVTTSPEFALKLAPKLPRSLRPGILLAFRGEISIEMRKEFRGLGYRNFTTPQGPTITDWILP